MQKNGPARVESTGGRVHRRPLRHESTAGLPDRATASQRQLLSVREGSEDGATRPDARAGAGSCALWLSPPARLAGVDPAKALEALADVGVMSSFGRMQLEAVRARASSQLHDADSTTTALAYLREHAKDSPSAFERALITTDKLDEAARYLIDRLADPTTRLDALADAQSYRVWPAPPPVELWRTRWQRVLSRPDVLAAIQAVGRVDHYDLWAAPF